MVHLQALEKENTADNFHREVEKRVRSDSATSGKGSPPVKKNVFFRALPEKGGGGL